MALDFPATDQSPFEAPNGVTYVWDGQKWVAADLTSYLPITGGRLTGAVNQQEQAISTTWDLSTSNFWFADAIAVPTPTNGVNGQSGLIRFLGVPTSLPTELILPDNFNITAACIVPFYVRAANEILLGNPVEVS